MAKNLLPPIPQTPIGEEFSWRDWFRNLGNYIQVAQTGGSPWTIVQGGTGSSTAVGARSNLGIGTLGTQNANNVAITGGTIDNTPIGAGTPSTGKFTTLDVTTSLKTEGLTGYLYGHDNTGNVTASATIPNTDVTGLATVAHTGAYSDLTGKPTLGTMAAQNVGINATITTAKLTTLGTNGSMTFTNGILTSQTQAT